MSSRTYLSIGDVLTLLREEFPDVTISKIRFLESQGLVNPERSPSGYRKFFDHDVERLRWVLRQQREHFLPLKVIRDRLADGELDETGAGARSEASNEGNGGNGKPARAAGALHASGPSNASSTATASSTEATTDEQPTKADEEAMARILADASRRTAQLPDAALMPSAAAARRGLQVVDDAHGSTVDASRQQEPVSVGGGAALGASTRSVGPEPTSGARSTAGPGATAQKTAGGGGPSDASGATGGEPSKPPAAEPATAKASNPPSSGRAREPARRRPRRDRTETAARRAASAGAAAGGGAGTSVVTGASMTGEEVCAASGLSPEELAGLEGFGLIASIDVAGIATYDEDALTLAILAAQFRAYGIEARHLRLYRNAVDRELGLIEQVIIPLLRQRNPEARQRAVETTDQLASLGQSMRATLLHQALRQHLGG